MNAQQIADAAEGRRPNSTGWIRINCPVCVDRHHSRDTEKSLGVHHETGVFLCFRCGATGRTKVGDSLDSGYDPPPPREFFGRPPEATPLFGEQPEGPSDALSYLLQTRGFTPRHLLLSMAHSVSSGYWEGRVIFPHYHRETLWGWTGRSYTDTHELSKLYPSGMARDLLYNQEVLELPLPETPVFLVESVTSSLRLLPHAVASLGQPTNTHAETLASTGSRPLIVVLDGDHWRDSRRLARELTYSRRWAKAILLPPGSDPDTQELRDPGSLTRAAQHLLNSSDGVVDFSPASVVEVEEDYG